GATSGCKVGTACAEGEQISLTVDFFGYNKSCAPHTYSWKVDGASIGTGTTATTTLTKGNHTLECVLFNGTQTIDLTQTVVVGQGAQPLFTFDFKGGALSAAGVPANTWVFNLTSDPG